MACNCATDKQLKKLYEQFGKTPKSTKDMKTTEKIGRYLNIVGVMLVMAFIIPVLFIYVIIKGLSKDKSISLAEFFGFRKKILPNNV